MLCATSGEQALRLAAAHAGRIDLLLTDVVMPGMSGQELATQVAAQRPGIRILYMSGYTEHTIAGSGDANEAVPFLQKPFTREHLAEAVRKAIRQGGS